ncbi:hypothetical protein ACFOMH_11960 [Paracoccus mangrovi]|uniref:Uncharacterized protein n=1 Tax=Paracoccus mangrovi TaxID=1715645 RepID=A0ABV7R6I0_9RHOB
MRWIRLSVYSLGFLILILILLAAAVISGLIPVRVSVDLLEQKVCRVVFLSDCKYSAPLIDAKIRTLLIGISQLRIAIDGKFDSIGVGDNYKKLIAPHATISEGKILWSSYRVWLTGKYPPKVSGDGKNGTVEVHLDSSGAGRPAEWATLNYSIVERKVAITTTYRDLQPPPPNYCPAGASPTISPPQKEVITPALWSTVDVGNLPSDLWRKNFNKREREINNNIQYTIGKLLIIGLQDPTLRLGGDGGPDPWFELSITLPFKAAPILADQIYPAKRSDEMRGVLELAWLLITADPDARHALAVFLENFPRHSFLAIHTGDSSFGCRWNDHNRAGTPQPI